MPVFENFMIHFLYPLCDLYDDHEGLFCHILSNEDAITLITSTELTPQLYNETTNIFFIVFSNDDAKMYSLH